MAVNLSRRLMLTGAMGASITGAAACASNVGATGPAIAEAAFPPSAVPDP